MCCITVFNCNVNLSYDIALQYVHVWYNCTVLWVTVTWQYVNDDEIDDDLSCSAAPPFE